MSVELKTAFVGGLERTGLCVVLHSSEQGAPRAMPSYYIPGALFSKMSNLARLPEVGRRDLPILLRWMGPCQMDGHGGAVSF